MAAFGAVEHAAFHGWPLGFAARGDQVLAHIHHSDYPVIVHLRKAAGPYIGL